MNSKIINRFSEPLIFLFLAAVYLAFQWRYINIDFWNDEIFTLKNFVFASVETPVSFYPVPNNHVFFSLLANVYVKIIGVDSLSELMDAPYKLRILPLLFSLTTLIFVYKTAKEILHKNAAIISTIILITSIPFLQFALQIRGYGLSTLLVSIILYLLVRYWKKKKTCTLFVLPIVISLLLYTMPSNVYFVLSISSFFFIILLFNLIQKRFTKNSLPILSTGENLKILVSFLVGSLLSLALYAPIFTNVFMNSYVDSYTVDSENQLMKFAPQVLESFISFRWGLVLLFFAGLYFAIKENKENRYLIFLLLISLTLPFILSYIRNDHPPVRIFEYLIPAFTLFISMGVFAILKKLVKSGSVQVLVIFCLLVYSAVTIAMEFKKIDKTMAEKIENTEKMQDLYYQYYLSHYHPYKELKDLKEKYYSITNLPVLAGAEPHDLPDYLRKFQIWYLGEKYLDSLINLKDSVYVISNFPGKLKLDSDYDIQILNDSPSYYNILKYKKNRELYYEIMPMLANCKKVYSDSVFFLFNLSDAFVVKDWDSLPNAIFINNKYQKKIGEIIQKISEKKYVCYFESIHANVPNLKNIYNVLYNEHADKVEFINKDKFSCLILKKGAIPKDSTMYFNDYEQDYSFWNKSNYIDNKYSYSGKKSEQLNENNVYSSTLSGTAQELKIDPKTSFNISCRLRFEKDKASILVVEVSRNGSNYLWNGIDLNDYYTGNKEWEKIIATYTPDKEILKNDLIKIYIWNKDKNQVWVDDFQVKIEQP